MAVAVDSERPRTRDFRHHDRNQVTPRV